MIQVIKQLTADNADILAGTDLENIPAYGQLDIFAGSSAADTKFSVRKPGAETLLAAQLLQLKANGVVSLQDDIPMSLPCFGGRYILDLDVTGAATVNIVVIFRDLADFGIG